MPHKGLSPAIPAPCSGTFVEKLLVQCAFFTRQVHESCAPLSLSALLLKYAFGGAANRKTWYEGSLKKREGRPRVELRCNEQLRSKTDDFWLKPCLQRNTLSNSECCIKLPLWQPRITLTVQMRAAVRQPATSKSSTLSVSICLEHSRTAHRHKRFNVSNFQAWSSQRRAVCDYWPHSDLCLVSRAIQIASVIGHSAKLCAVPRSKFALCWNDIIMAASRYRK